MNVERWTFSPPQAPSLAVFALIVTCTLLFNNSAPAQGFTPESVQSFLEKRGSKTDGPANKIEDARMIEFLAKVANFRTEAIGNWSLDRMKRQKNVLPGALDRLEQGKITREFRQLWEWVLVGTNFILGDSLSDRPVAALYNPFLDAALLTIWRYSPDDGYQLADAVPVTGQAMRERRASRKGDRPGWSKKGDSFEQQIVETAGRFTESFEAAHPPYGRQARPVPASDDSVRAALHYIEESSFVFIGWLIDARNPNAPDNYADLLRGVDRALGKETPEEFAKWIEKDNPISAEAIFRLKQPVRARMDPYLVLPNLVFLVDPYEVNGFISLRIHQAPEEQWVSSALFYSFAR